MTGRRQLRHCAIFAAVFGGLLGVCLWVNVGFTDFRGAGSVDFDGLRGNTVLMPIGVTVWQLSSVKFGYSETGAPPRIGVFGTHQAQFFAASALGKGTGRADFFNYTSVNPGLGEVRDYLLHLAGLGKLPGETVIVAAFQGDFSDRRLLTYPGNIPLSVALAGRTHFDEGPLGRARHLFEQAMQQLRRVFGYQNFFTGVFASQRLVPIALDACGKAMSEGGDPVGGALARLPGTMLLWAGIAGPDAFCRSPALRAAYLDGSFTADGSLFRASPASPGRYNFLADEQVRLRDDDEDLIVRYLKQIREIVESRGRRFIFWIPPVNGAFRPGKVNRILDRALKRIPGLDLVDHRRLAPRDDFFFDHLHPTPAYFRFFTDELFEKGLLTRRAATTRG